MSRCWRRWKHVHLAIQQLRDKHWRLESHRLVIHAKLQARLAQRVLAHWHPLAHHLAGLRLDFTLDAHRQHRLASSCFAAWRQVVAWWASSSLLKSYRCPQVVARWSALRVKETVGVMRHALLRLRASTAVHHCAHSQCADSREIAGGGHDVLFEDASQHQAPRPPLAHPLVHWQPSQRSR